jgi:uncharacterized damage-inducible protein DinB
MRDDTVDDKSVIESLFRHNRWANLKLLDFCAGLSDEQLGATATGAFGSIRATLAHLVGAEVDYVCRVTGRAMPEWVSERRWPGIETLKEDAGWSGEALEQIAVAARAHDVVRETEQGLWAEYPLAALLVQAINHATEHRSQISAIITALGLEPPNLDGWGIMEELGQFREGTLD